MTMLLAASDTEAPKHPCEQCKLHSCQPLPGKVGLEVDHSCSLEQPTDLSEPPFIQVEGNMHLPVPPAEWLPGRSWGQWSSTPEGST